MKVLTLGEIMLRLKSPGQERLFQSGALEATFGGGEANVAVSLANYGVDTEFCTVLPENTVGDACIRELHYHHVGTGRILRGKGRMGIYFLEGGANQLPSRVVYDREYSAIALARPEDFDWAAIFEGIDWFHITGITPALSESAKDLSLFAVMEAKRRNITVSCDLNYRKNLWKYGAPAREVMGRLACHMAMPVLPRLAGKFSQPLAERCGGGPAPGAASPHSGRLKGVTGGLEGPKGGDSESPLGPPRKKPPRQGNFRFL